MLKNAQPHIFFEPGHHWQNYHLNVSFTPGRYYDLWNLLDDGSEPKEDRWRAGLSAISQIVQDAEKHQQPIRAVGAGWSLSQATVTSGYLLNTKPLNFTEIGLHGENRDPRCQIPADQLVFAQCGASVLELNMGLESSGLALPTSGATNGQTICGAISTGTHGAALTYGAMQEMAVGLHIIAEGGAAYWIERASQPVASEHFCNFLGATLIRDDELFNAALVSFGSFGILHAVLLKADPIYLLETYIWRREYDEIKPLLGSLDFRRMGLEYPGETPYHFQVLIDPYATRHGRSGAFLQYMYKRPWQPVAPPETKTVSLDTGPNIALAARFFSDLIPPSIPLLSRLIAAGQIKLAQAQLASPGDTFSTSNIPVGGLSTEIAVAQHDAPRAIDAIVEIAHHYPFPALASLRYVAPSKALLAFTRFEPTTCMIELPAAASHRTHRAYEMIWNALEDRGIPYAFHWGQVQRPNPVLLRRVFGDRVDRWKAARRKFLKSTGRSTFSNPMLDAWGLGDQHGT